LASCGNALNDSWMKFGRADKVSSYLKITLEEYYLY